MPSPIRREFPPMPRPQRIAFDHFEVDMRSGRTAQEWLAHNGCRLSPLNCWPSYSGTPAKSCRETKSAANFGQPILSSTSNHSLAASVNKIRDALGDSAEKSQIHRDPS